MKLILLAGRAAVFIAAILLGTGCQASPGPTATEAATPNATLLAISQMLTVTSAAPSPTPTIFTTPTQTPVPTATLPKPGSQQKPGKMGETLQSDGVSLVAISARVQPTAGKLKAMKGRAYLNVEVQLGDVSKETVPYTPLFFKLVGAEDEGISPAVDAEWPGLQSGDLIPGEQVRGYIAFDVPEGSKPSDFRMQYTPSFPITGLDGAWIALSQTDVQVPLTGSGVDTTSKLPGVGIRVEAGGLALVVNQVTAQVRMYDRKATEGRIFVELQVMIENVNHTLAPYNPGYFMVKDADGYEFPSVALPSKDLLQAGGLQRGQKVSGRVVFEIPQNDTRVMVKYQPLVLTEEYQEIRIMVPVPKASKK